MQPGQSAPTRAEALASARELSIGGLMIALGILVPWLFHFGGPQAGRAFLPMFLPVLMCGLLSRPAVAGTVGFVTPLLSGALTGMPPVPEVFLMPFELCALGTVASLAYRRGRFPLLLAVVVGMLSARAVRVGAILAVIPALPWLEHVGALGEQHAAHLRSLAQHLWAYVVVGYLVGSLPGIILQLTVAPGAVRAVEKLGLLAAPGAAAAGEAP